MYNDEYDKNVRNSKIQDVTREVFNDLLNKCNKHNNDEPVFYISLPRDEQLIFDFYKLACSSLKLKNVIELDKTDEEVILVAIEGVAKYLVAAKADALAVIKMDKSGNILRIYQEEE